MKRFDFFLFKLFISIIFFLVLGIICKTNKYYHDKIHYYLYEQSFNFNSVYSFYNRYLGSFSMFDINNNTSQVFTEEFKYNSLEEYKDGIKLFVDYKHLILSLSTGTIIYMGNKNGYNNLIIVNTDNNINIWYGNICNTSLKLFDFVNKDTYLGESCKDFIYIAYEKNGKFLNYSKYFKL